MRKAREAFTLIEVMVSVVIISTVIMALLELFSNNSLIFSNLEKKSKINQYLSFMLSNEEYGVEDDKATLYDLFSEFDLEDDLRRDLKEVKTEIVYQEVDTIDMSEYDGSDDEDEKEEEMEEPEDVKESSDANMVFEIGRTVLKLNDTSGAILRIRLQ